MFRKFILASACLAVLFLGAATDTGATPLNATERGTYRDNGLFGTAGSGTSVGNYITGGLANGAEFRSFFNFDLSGVTGTVTEAVLTLSLNRTVALSPDPSESIAFFDVTESLPDLIDGSGGRAAFDDLGSGRRYGFGTLSTDLTSGVLSVALNALALLDLNAAIGGDFALGGALTSLSGETELLFGFSNLGQQQPTQLNLTTVAQAPNPVAIPEPGSFTLISLGLFALAMGRWKFRIGQRTACNGQS
ncbi:hypothetical protein [Pelagibius sp. Alg239-R121]|uniref:hypothetical protein n=1 Tax=Pelagibius sp. Alg239-R121 TaxID=2993448 RepID=UPI0024A6B7E6|nr:hypothetical protein [Pelagibius sp. Alg239-R121]